MAGACSRGSAIRRLLSGALVVALLVASAPGLRAQDNVDESVDFFVMSDLPRNAETLQFIEWFLRGFVPVAPKMLHGPYSRESAGGRLSWEADRFSTWVQPISARSVASYRQSGLTAAAPPVVFVAQRSEERRPGAHYVVIPSDLHGEDLLFAACEAGRAFLGYGECVRDPAGEYTFAHRIEFEVRDGYEFRDGRPPVDGRGIRPSAPGALLRFLVSLPPPQVGEPLVESPVEPAGALSRSPIGLTLARSLERGIEAGSLRLTVRDRNEVVPVQRAPGGLVLSADGLTPGVRQFDVEVRDTVFGRLLHRSQRSATVFTREDVFASTGQCIPEHGNDCSTRPLWMGSSEYELVLPPSYRAIHVEVQERRELLLFALLGAMLLAFFVQRHRRKTQRIRAIAVASIDADYRGNRGVRVVPVDGDVILSELAPELSEAGGMVRSGVLSSGTEFALSDGTDRWRSWRATLDCDELGVWDNGCRYVALDAEGAKRLLAGATLRVEPPTAPPDGDLPSARPSDYTPTSWRAVFGGPLGGLAAVAAMHPFVPFVGLASYTIAGVLLSGVFAALAARRA